MQSRAQPRIPNRVADLRSKVAVKSPNLQDIDKIADGQKLNLQIL